MHSRWAPIPYTSVYHFGCSSLTFLAVIADRVEVQKVGADQRVVDRVHVLQLKLDALTQRREHLREDDLLVPHRCVATLLHWSAALETQRQSLPVKEILSSWNPVITVLQFISRCLFQCVAWQRPRSIPTEVCTFCVGMSRLWIIVIE